MGSKLKIIVIVGPTASGKSAYAVELAHKIGGEVISADSRQVYKGLDIGTGKITKEEMRDIPHHLLDVADPKERFSVSDWKLLAERAIEDIHSRGKVPIIVGGTGFYVSALIDNMDFPEVSIDPKAQSTLESKPANELFAELERIDPDRADMMSENGESTNKRRIARAILIARQLGKVPPKKTGESKYEVEMIGIAPPDDELKAKIRARLLQHIDDGMIEEAKRLHEPPPTGISLSYERMDELGLEYRYLSKYLQGGLTRDQLIETLATKIWQYARRQKTWWRKDKRVIYSVQPL